MKHSWGGVFLMNKLVVAFINVFIFGGYLCYSSENTKEKTLPSYDDIRYFLPNSSYYYFTNKQNPMEFFETKKIQDINETRYYMWGSPITADTSWNDDVMLSQYSDITCHLVFCDLGIVFHMDKALRKYYRSIQSTTNIGNLLFEHLSNANLKIKFNKDCGRDKNFNFVIMCNPGYSNFEVNMTDLDDCLIMKYVPTELCAKKYMCTARRTISKK